MTISSSDTSLKRLIKCKVSLNVSKGSKPWKHNALVIDEDGEIFGTLKDVIETGIVFDNQYPYIAIAIANKGGSIGAYTEVLKLINYINDIMNEYVEFNNK